MSTSASTSTMKLSTSSSNDVANSTTSSTTSYDTKSVNSMEREKPTCEAKHVHALTSSSPSVTSASSSVSAPLADTNNASNVCNTIRSQDTLPKLHLQRTRFDHIDAECTSLTLAPTGNFVCAGFTDGTVRLFDSSGTLPSSSTFFEHRNRYYKRLHTKGFVVANITPRGVHTKLNLMVQLTPDARYCFAGVLRGNVEMVAVDLGAILAYQHPLQGEKESESDSSSMNELDLSNIMVHRHADAKLRGFGACTRVRHQKKYKLCCGKGIKNIHIWSFTPASSSDVNTMATPSKAVPAVWECLYSIPTTGRSVMSLQFRYSEDVLQVIGKSDGGVLKVWNLHDTEDNSADITSSQTGTKERSINNGKPYSTHSKYANTEEALGGMYGNTIPCIGCDVGGTLQLVNTTGTTLEVPLSDAISDDSDSNAGRSRRQTYRNRSRNISTCVNVQGTCDDELLNEIPDAHGVVQMNRKIEDGEGECDTLWHIICANGAATAVYSTHNSVATVGNAPTPGDSQALNTSISSYSVTRAGCRGTVLLLYYTWNSLRKRGSINIQRLASGYSKSATTNNNWGYLDLIDVKKVRKELDKMMTKAAQISDSTMVPSSAHNIKGDAVNVKNETTKKGNVRNVVSKATVKSLSKSSGEITKLKNVIKHDIPKAVTTQGVRKHKPTPMSTSMPTDQTPAKGYHESAWITPSPNTSTQLAPSHAHHVATTPGRKPTSIGKMMVSSPVGGIGALFPSPQSRGSSIGVQQAELVVRNVLLGMQDVTDLHHTLPTTQLLPPPHIEVQKEKNFNQVQQQQCGSRSAQKMILSEKNQEVSAVSGGTKRVRITVPPTLKSTKSKSSTVPSCAHPSTGACVIQPPIMASPKGKSIGNVTLSSNPEIVKLPVYPEMRNPTQVKVAATSRRKRASEDASISRCKQRRRGTSPPPPSSATTTSSKAVNISSVLESIKPKPFKPSAPVKRVPYTYTPFKFESTLVQSLKKMHATGVITNHNQERLRQKNEVIQWSKACRVQILRGMNSVTRSKSN